MVRGSLCTACARPLCTARWDVHGHGGMCTATVGCARPRWVVHGHGGLCTGHGGHGLCTVSHGLCTVAARWTLHGARPLHGLHLGGITSGTPGRRFTEPHGVPRSTRSTTEYTEYHGVPRSATEYHGVHGVPRSTTETHEAGILAGLPAQARARAWAEAGQGLRQGQGLAQGSYFP